MNDYRRKRNAFCYLRSEYKKLIYAGKYGPGMNLMYKKICQLAKELKNNFIWTS